MAKKGSKKGGATAATGAAQPRNYLAEAVNALNTNTPLMATEAEMAPLLNDPRGPLVEFNRAVAQGDKIAFRATQLGVQAMSNPQPQPGAPATAPVAAWGAPGATTPAATVPQGGAPAGGTQSAQAPASPRPTITYDMGVPIPAPRRGGRGSTVYGFETMQVGASFYIPATDDNPNPAKRIASTVSSASNRLEPKKFIVRSVDETAQGRGKGARVWRTE
jgi:hypothetical protein